MDGFTTLLAVLVVWLTHRTLLGVRRLLEPTCARCGGRQWVREGADGWACAACTMPLQAQVQAEGG